MKARLISFFLLAVLSAGVGANPCATGGRPFPVGEDSGMGGTGLRPGQGEGSGTGGTGHGDGSGTGGTGHGDGSGNGGTGQQARTDGDSSGAGGTGVVGEITGFGSICVNELEIHYDAKTPVSVNGQASRADQLAVGQVVAVRAEGKGASLRAKDIQVRHTLVGRVEAVNQDGQLRVWGQWVRPPLISHVQQGERIKVSGQRTDSRHVVASRIDPAQPGEPDVLSGEVEWSQANETQVGGVRIRLPEGADRPKPGQEFRASGRAEAGGFKAERIELDGLRGFMGQMDRLSVKDRIRPAGQPGKLRVGGVEFTLDAKTRVKGGSVKEMQSGRLVQVEARQKDGRAVVERIEFRTDGVERNQEKSSGETAKSRHSAVKDERNSSQTQQTEERDGREAHAERSREEDEHAKSDRSESRADAAETTERNEKSERGEKAEKVEKQEKPERTEKVEKPEKVERLERPEKVEKPEKPERIERPEKPEIDD